MRRLIIVRLATNSVGLALLSRLNVQCFPVFIECLSTATLPLKFSASRSLLANRLSNSLTQHYRRARGSLFFIILAVSISPFRLLNQKFQCKRDLSPSDEGRPVHDGRTTLALLELTFVFKVFKL